ncbi:MAG: YdcF family protein [Candidatus Acidiferrales bacterium]
MTLRSGCRFAPNSQQGGIFFRLLFLLFFGVFLFAIYVARHPLLRLAGEFWIVSEPPQASDAIVILGDDNYQGDRAARAAELFHAGSAPRVVASGRFLRPYASIAQLEEHDLESHGVPAGAIVRLEHLAANTREEAMAISQLASARGWKRIIVVTSNYHTRRSKYIFERTLPPGIVLYVVAAPDSDYDPSSWWRTRGGMKIFFHETVGMMVALWEMRHSDVQTVSEIFFHNFHSDDLSQFPQFIHSNFHR